MSIYKEAQAFLFQDENTLTSFFGSISDQEFEEYLSVLSGIHEDVSSGMPLEDSLARQAAPEVHGYINRVVGAIGPMFSSMPYAAIEGKLRGLRTPEEQLLSQPELFDDRKIKYTRPKDMLNLLKQRTDEFIAYYATINFPDSNMREVNRLKEDLDVFRKKLDFIPEAPEMNLPPILREANRELTNIIARLNLQSEIDEDDEYFEQEEEVVEEEVEETPSTIEEPEPEQEIAVEPEEDLELDISTVDTSNLQNHIIFRGIKDPLDESTSPPTVDTSVFDQIYSNFKDYIRQIKAQEDSIIKNPEGKSSSKKSRAELDAVMCALKEFSIQLLNRINSLKDAAEPSLSSKFNGLISEVSDSLPTSKLLRDGLLKEAGFFDTVIWLSNSRLYKYVRLREMYFAAIKEHVMKPQGLGQYIEDYDPKATKIHEAGGGLSDFFVSVEEYLERVFLEGMRSFLNLRVNDKNDKFRKFFSLDPKIIYRNAYVEKYSLKKKTYRPCPVCFKSIPFSKSDDFRVVLFSMFKENGDPITEVELEATRRWPPPPPGIFARSKSSQDSIQAILSYSGDASWKQISAMINSSDKNKQQEGWHRRAGVLMSLGARRLVELNISSIMNRCPNPEAKGDRSNSMCGIGYSAPGESLPMGALSLQPGWNGSKDPGLEGRGIDPDSYINKYTISADKEVIQNAQTTQRAGFKFSKNSFACPCRISHIDGDATFKYRTMVISSTGPIGFSSGTPALPTKPDGGLDYEFAREKGSMAFLVCGAPTSLSSFDRDSSSDGYILNYLENLRSQDKDSYRNVMDSLIRDGIDVSIAMKLDFNMMLGKLGKDLKAKANDYSFKLRKKELSNILTKVAAMLSEEQIELYNDLTLICPLGHRFTVGESLAFGEKYVSIQSAGLLGFGDSIKTLGEKNLSSLITGKKPFLVPASDFPEHKGLPYEEWNALPEEERTYTPISGSTEKIVLKFMIPNRNTRDFTEYFLNPTHKKSMRGQVWSGRETYFSKQLRDKYIRSEETGPTAVGIQAETKDDGSYSRIDVQEHATAPSVDRIFNPDHIREKVLGGESDIIFTPVEIPTPGTMRLDGSDPRSFAKVLDSKINDLFKAVNNRLRVIFTYTDTLSQRIVSNIILGRDKKLEYSVDLKSYISEFSAVADQLYSSIVDGRPEVTRGASSDGISEFTDYALSLANNKIKNLENWLMTNSSEIQRGEDEVFEIFYIIMSSSFKEAEGAFSSDTYQVIRKDAYADDNQFGKAFATALRNLKSYNFVSKYVLYDSPDFQRARLARQEYSLQILLTSYALHTAKSLVEISNLYFDDPGNSHYIGYDIGIDLSSIEAILGKEMDGEWVGGITPEEVQENMVEAFNDIPRSERKMINSDTAADMGQRIDKAYYVLLRGAKEARFHIGNPKLISNAYEFLSNKAAFVANVPVGQVKDKLDSVLPTRTFRFTGSTEILETTLSALPRFRKPFIDKTAPFPVKYIHKRWLVINPLQKYADDLEHTGRTFRTQEEAQQYAAKLNEIYAAQLAEHGERSGIGVMQAHYYSNEDIGYDGSKYQLGMFGDKPGEALSWPPPTYGYESSAKPGFVGILLPFHIEGSKTHLSTATDMMVLDTRVVIDIEGIPTDITFLLKRGSTREDAIFLTNAENKIIKILEDIEHAEILYKHENEQAIKEDPGLLARHRKQIEEQAKEQIDVLLKKIYSRPLAIRSASTFEDSRTEKKVISSPMAAIVLEDPMRCYRLIVDPAKRGVVLSQEEKERLIQFVIDVYNLDAIRDVVRDFTDNPKFESRDLFTTTEFKRKKGAKGGLAANLKGEWTSRGGQAHQPWRQQPGRYYDVVPADEESDIGSYFQYVYNILSSESKVGGSAHRTRSDLHTFINSMRNDNLLMSKKSAVGFVPELADQMLRFLESEMNPRGRKKKASDKSYRFFERRRELERTILSMGIVDLNDS
jgi:hypothetical protein